MLTKQDVIAHCLGYAGAFEDHPFDDNWILMRHTGNRKSFAMIFEREGHIWINLKTEPYLGHYWREQYAAVQPAYHMNKIHWISVILDGSMTDEDVVPLIRASYELTRPKHRVP